MTLRNIGYMLTEELLGQVLTHLGSYLSFSQVSKYIPNVRCLPTQPSQQVHSSPSPSSGAPHTPSEPSLEYRAHKVITRPHSISSSRSN
jgi:hypothetical protein